ncbi:Hypothetical protein FKW44_014373 [Caligus rogercresseyi]|uniref:Uncharacterized protein n=1 Tax=Caligus rogercresseyi TaxID=217165 RepID=A0A7T8K0D9_CALRO|nr:Hypothetical protein FKW44_014373 [Caligus rogercresseyi]
MTEFARRSRARTTVSNAVKAAGGKSKGDNRIVQIWMEENMKHHRDRAIFFSDEKTSPWIK